MTDSVELRAVRARDGRCGFGSVDGSPEPRPGAPWAAAARHRARAPRPVRHPKHGLEGLSDVLRLELGLLGMHVAVVEPGYVSTAMRGKLERDTQETVRALPEEGRARYEGRLTTLAATISEHAAHGSPPEVLADAVHHPHQPQAADALPGRRGRGPAAVPAPGSSPTADSTGC